jgi:hypothetical protein
VAAAVTVIVGGSSCSTQSKGALMLAISTDMQTPKDISVVSVYVETNGVPKFDYLGRVLPDGSVALPATLAVVQPDDPQAHIRIRVIGFKEQNARVLRDVVTTVPPDRVGLLWLPLNLLDDGSGQGSLPAAQVPLGVHTNSPRSKTPTVIVPLGGAPEGLTSWNPLSITSRCDFTKGLTSINGRCVNATVDSSSLPTYAPEAVYGDAGVQASGAPVACFDVATCFAGAMPVMNVDLTSCTFPVGAASVSNVALVTPSTGACVSAGECFVPLENDPAQGWNESGGVVTLIPGVCDQLRSGASLFAVAGGCPPMTESTPVCEPLAIAADGGPASDATMPIADASMGDGPTGPGADASVSDGPTGPGADASVSDGPTTGPSDGGPCVPATCTSLMYTCGFAADGCGGSLQCGPCNAPETCGGGGTPFTCGPTCTGLCQQQVACDGGVSTTVTGKVVAGSPPDGGGVPDPVPNVVVFVPTGALQPFPTGAQCTQCTPTGPSLVATTTAVDGSFTLTNMPVGTNIPLVIQLGRWRREITLPSVTACTNNTVGNVAMPTSKIQGDIPLIAISSAATETHECVLLGMGISQSEFTTPSGGGRIHLYSGNGAVLPGSPTETALTGAGGTLMNYDMVLFPCWGQALAKPAADLANFVTYVNSGGRALITHFGYEWLYTNGPFSTVAAWNVNHNASEPGVAGNFQTKTPQTLLFQQWATNVGASMGPQFLMTSAKHDVNSVAGASQDWIDGTDPLDSTPQVFLFTADTPVGTAPASQCGRVAYADFHANQVMSGPTYTFPTECSGGPLTPEEKAIEYMIWNLSGSSCVQAAAPPSCTPLTCASQGIQCGPAGDGCGNLIPTCGPCPTSQTCGGGGFGKCG